MDFGLLARSDLCFRDVLTITYLLVENKKKTNYKQLLYAGKVI